MTANEKRARRLFKCAIVQFLNVQAFRITMTANEKRARRLFKWAVNHYGGDLSQAVTRTSGLTHCPTRGAGVPTGTMQTTWRNLAPMLPHGLQRALKRAGFDVATTKRAIDAALLREPS